MSKIYETRHTGIVVSDMSVSLRFYQGFLGLSSVFDTRRTGHYISSLAGLDDTDVEIHVLGVADGSRVELLKFHSHPHPAPATAELNHVGRSHIAFSVTDLNQLYDARQHYGVTFKSSPIHSPDGVLVCFCYDPDGTLVELVEPTR